MRRASVTNCKSYAENFFRSFNLLLFAPGLGPSLLAVFFGRPIISPVHRLGERAIEVANELPKFGFEVLLAAEVTVSHHTT